MPDETGDSALAVATAAARRRSVAARKGARTRAENARLDALWRHERDLWQAGYAAIAGVDEVGVGPLAGPVVAAAVILPSDFKAPGLWECKKLLADKRPHFYELIRDQAIAFGIGVVSVEELDRINIHQAALKAMRLALAEVEPAPDCALVDGFVIPGLPLFQRPIVNGDEQCMSIAAASVIAKVTRDRIMERLDRVYPGYGFAGHKGYGTRGHRAALERLGPCPVHRRSFAPIRAFTDTGADAADDAEADEAEQDSAPEGELMPTGDDRQTTLPWSA